MNNPLLPSQDPVLITLHDLITASVLPLVALHRDGSIAALNEGAGSFLARGEWASVVQGRLRIARAADAKRMSELIESLVSDPHPQARRIMRIDIPTDARQRFAHLQRLTVRDTGISPLILLTIKSLDDAIALSEAALEVALDLTPAEAQLALALANGMSAKDYCAANGREMTTVRWHLGNIRRKLQARNLQDLVRVIHLIAS